ITTPPAPGDSSLRVPHLETHDYASRAWRLARERLRDAAVDGKRGARRRRRVRGEEDDRVADVRRRDDRPQQVPLPVVVLQRGGIEAAGAGARRPDLLP